MNPASLSPARLAANRRNARKSTGPRTPAGKLASSRNAIRCGVFCRALLLPGESRALFRALWFDALHQFNPRGHIELSLVELIVESRWKLRRVQLAESHLLRHERQVLQEQPLIEQLEQSNDLPALYVEPLPTELPLTYSQPPPGFVIKRPAGSGEPGAAGDLCDKDNDCHQSDSDPEDGLDPSGWKMTPVEYCPQSVQPPPGPTGPISIGHTLAFALSEKREADRLERLQRYAQRLENTIHRTLRSLHALQQRWPGPEDEGADEGASDEENGCYINCGKRTQTPAPAEAQAPIQAEAEIQGPEEPQVSEETRVGVRSSGRERSAGVQVPVKNIISMFLLPMIKFANKLNRR